MTFKNDVSFKVTQENNFTEAGKCFKKSAKLHKAMKNNHRTANDYAEAAKCYKKVDGHGL